MKYRIGDQGYSFDDLLIKPRKSSVMPKDVSVETWLTRNIKIKIPLVSAAMDTITENCMARTIAKFGGIGIIHKNMSVSRRIEEIKSVKKTKSWIIRNPEMISMYDTRSDAKKQMADNQISGLLVINEHRKLTGIITHRDLLSGSADDAVEAIMTPFNKLCYGIEGITKDYAKSIMVTNKIEKLPIVVSESDNKTITGLITLRDLQDIERHPDASIDINGQLLVGIAIGVEDDDYVIGQLVDAGVNMISLDCAHAHNDICLDKLRHIKANYPKLDIIAGNIATKEAAKFFCHSDIVDAIKVGMGPGSICTTRKVTGVGVPQMSAIMECSKIAHDYEIPVIADGGIKVSGDIVKALAAGASAVMIGSMFSGTNETPGDIKKDVNSTYKEYRGMGSAEAMNAYGHDRYGKISGKHVPEGVSVKVPYKGSISHLIPEYIGGLKSGMGYTDCKCIKDLWYTTFIPITEAGYIESIAHINRY